MIQINCPICRVPNFLIGWGFRRTKERGRIQRYKCTRCNKTWCENDGFWHKHKPKHTILSVLSQWWKGLTSRELADEHGITQKTVLRWLHEYTMLLFKHLCKLIQKTTKKLHLDELFLRMCGCFHYVWDAICADTRFMLLFLSAFRDAIAAEQFLEQCPLAEETVSDGYSVYPVLVRERYKGQTKHSFCVRFEDKRNNNIVERLQNTLRRFLHPRRGFNSLQTAGMQLAGFWVYYNFIRKHSAIGMTPAEKAGLIEYRDLNTVKERLQFLIEQAVIFWLRILSRFLQSYQP